MKSYDVIVIGSGAGATVMNGALAHGLSVALVDRGPLGGTCSNVGCIPSKMLVYPAHRIVEIERASRLGIRAEILDIDFAAIMERMRAKVRDGECHTRAAFKNSKVVDLYDGEGHFVGDSTLEIGGQAIRGKMIFIVAGARPVIPEGLGLERVDYLTNESVLALRARPRSMVILGGGYIAVEYGHFFAAMGTRVTIVQRNARLVPREEPEVSDLLASELRERMEIHTGTAVVLVRSGDGECVVTAKDSVSGRTLDLSAEALLVVAGRRSNADLLHVKETGVETDARGYIQVDAALQTNKKNIWAFGDIIGKEMFRHVANHEASIAMDNAIHSAGRKMDYRSAPHAVFTYPEVASVGLKEAQAIAQYGASAVLVGRAEYAEVAMGAAMRETSGFAKTIVSREKGDILGCHIIGPSASILIQEVVNAMASGGGLRALAAGIRVHPALPEVVAASLNRLTEVVGPGTR